MAKQAATRYRQLVSEVDRAENIATDRAPTAAELGQVDELVAALRLSTGDGEKYAKLLRRAKAVQRRLSDPERIRQAIAKGMRAKQRGLREALPAGLVGSTGLDLARREVPGGLPSSRRGH
jgi:hypothetical protein